MRFECFFGGGGVVRGRGRAGDDGVAVGLGEVAVLRLALGPRLQDVPAPPPRAPRPQVGPRDGPFRTGRARKVDAAPQDGRARRGWAASVGCAPER